MELYLSLTLLPVPGTLFLLLGYLAQPRCKGFCVVLLYHVLSCWLLFLGGLLFAGEKGGTVGEGRLGDLGGVEVEGTVVAMYCMR